MRSLTSRKPSACSTLMEMVRRRAGKFELTFEIVLRLPSAERWTGPHSTALWGMVTIMCSSAPWGYLLVVGFDAMRRVLYFFRLEFMNPLVRSFVVVCRRGNGPLLPTIACTPPPCLFDLLCHGAHVPFVCFGECHSHTAYFAVPVIHYCGRYHHTSRVERSHEVARPKPFREGAHADDQLRG